MSARPSYAASIRWIALNDDSDLGDPETGWLVTIQMVADLFDKDPDHVGADVKKQRSKWDAAA